MLTYKVYQALCLELWGKQLQSKAYYSNFLLKMHVLLVTSSTSFNILTSVKTLVNRCGFWAEIVNVDCTEPHCLSFSPSRASHLGLVNRHIDYFLSSFWTHGTDKLVPKRITWILERHGHLAKDLEGGQGVDRACQRQKAHQRLTSGLRRCLLPA